MNRIFACGLVAYLIVGCGNQVEENHRSSPYRSQDAQVDPDLDDLDSESREPRRRPPKPSDKGRDDGPGRPTDDPTKDEDSVDQPPEEPRDPPGPGPSSLDWDGTSFVHSPTLRLIPTE